MPQNRTEKVPNATAATTAAAALLPLAAGCRLLPTGYSAYWLLLPLTAGYWLCAVLPYRIEVVVVRNQGQMSYSLACSPLRLPASADIYHWLPAGCCKNVVLPAATCCCLLLPACCCLPAAACSCLLLAGAGCCWLLLAATCCCLLLPAACCCLLEILKNPS